MNTTATATAAAPNLRAIGPNAAYIACRLATMPANPGSGAPRLSPEEIDRLLTAVDITRTARIVGASPEAVAAAIASATERSALRFIGAEVYGMNAAQLATTEPRLKMSIKDVISHVRWRETRERMQEQRADVARRLRNAPHHDRQILANVARRSGLIPVQMMADLVEFLGVIE